MFGQGSSQPRTERGSAEAADPEALRDIRIGTCRRCSGPTQHLLATTDRNQRTTRASFDYARCTRCHLMELENPPADLSSHYPRDYYRAPSRLQLRWAAWRERYQARLVGRFAAGGVLIDVGSAWGTFAFQARRAGFQVLGIERDPECCEYLSSVVGVRAIQSGDPARALAAAGPSQVITMWQVLEHLDDPWTTLDAAVRCLDRGGVLVVATPNPDSLGLRLLGSRWPHIDAPRHHWLIPSSVLSAFLAARGLDCVALTSSDVGARRWNRFAWKRAFANSDRAWIRKLQPAGSLIAVAMLPFEARADAGSCYTAVYRKRSE